MKNVYTGSSKTAKQLASSGKLKAGDIVLWTINHTDVYAGNKMFYDGGHTASSFNGCGNSCRFKTLGPGYSGNLWGRKVWKIYRLK